MKSHSMELPTGWLEGLEEGEEFLADKDWSILRVKTGETCGLPSFLCDYEAIRIDFCIELSIDCINMGLRSRGDIVLVPVGLFLADGAEVDVEDDWRGLTFREPECTQLMEELDWRYKFVARPSVEHPKMKQGGEE